MKTKIIACLLGLVAILVYSCQSEQELEFMRYYTTGQELYKTNCQNCHGAQGEGLAALIPPLTDSSYLRKNKQQLACYVYNGLKLPIIVNGKAYSGQMPASSLAPIQIAQVLTYVENSFGNKMGLHDVNAVNTELTKCE
ncbi:cytochrome c [Mucilaginibacter daejeonensis]|uniref:c-type cytochrome n=1 Tax=Mucilaginibacter daejeonensis TaxID=398049 RepID=UPI001D17C870|nr:cytochrome c [Mucilaginibacter daejeonensis]UEG55108.1 cytochrome c [Mucilaginibacter daejeonensis]